MKLSTKDFIEIIGVLAVVASLIFVGLELRQERLLSHASQGAALVESLAEFDQQFQDPVVATIYIKMVSDPKALNVEEMTQANALLDHIVRLWILDDYLYGLGIFDENQRILNEYTARMFGNAYAKAWWESKKDLFPEFSDRISKAVNETSVGDSMDFYNKIQTNILSK